MTTTIVGLNPALAAIIQDNTLQRMFKDALYPKLIFRADAMPELWEANIGDTMIFSRTGLLDVNTTPLTPGNDPTPKVYDTEQWRAIAHQYGDSIDTHMPTSRAALAPKILRDTKALGLNAGQTLNRLVRDALFRAYLGGNTVATANAAIGLTQFQVASLNGFTESLVSGELQPVSPANPIEVEFPGIAEPNRFVVAAVPANPANPLGPGTVTISVALTVGLTARDAVLALNRPIVFRVGGGNSVDAITAADTLTLSDIISAVSIVRGVDVPPHGDGYFHHHLSTFAEAQLFNDNHWQRLHEGMPDSIAYREFAVGVKAGCIHYRNTECPDSLNTGTLVATGANSSMSPSLGAEVINTTGVRIGRSIITGESSIYEKYIPEMEYISEAGVTGKVGNFTVINGGVAVNTDRIRYTMRAPLDRLQQIISQTWSFSGDFPVPSDETSRGASRFKRAVVIEHALG